MYPDKEIHYIFNNENMGYGKAHNITIKKSMEQELPYHIILNPDIVIQEGTLEKLTHYMNEHPEVGNIMPKIIYPDGQLQYLCKLLPSPIDLIFRRFIPFKKWRDNSNKHFELHNFSYNKIMNIPIRSEEHTSELQSHDDLVCRLLLEKKNMVQFPKLPYL